MYIFSFWIHNRPRSGVGSWSDYSKTSCNNNEVTSGSRCDVIISSIGPVNLKREWVRGWREWSHIESIIPRMRCSGMGGYASRALVSLYVSCGDTWCKVTPNNFATVSECLDWQSQLQMQQKQQTTMKQVLLKLCADTCLNGLSGHQW